MDITIKRNIDNDSSLEPLSKEEWVNYVSSSKNLVWLENCPSCVEYNYNGLTVPKHKLALYFSEGDPCKQLLGFNWDDGGEIVFGLGNDPDLMQIIIDVASDLNCVLQADEGTIITEPNDIENICFE